jgi:hypothetical protein
MVEVNVWVREKERERARERTSPVACSSGKVIVTSFPQCSAREASTPNLGPTAQKSVESSSTYLICNSIQ